MDTVTAWAASAWTATAFFVATNIEPSSGVLVAAFFGASLSAMTGEDRALGKTAVYFATGWMVGVFASQILSELIPLQNPHVRVGEAFFCALFAEKIVSGVHNGSLLSFITSLRGGSK